MLLVVPRSQPNPCAAPYALPLTEECARVRPQVVLLDLHMPGTPPLEALKELSAAAPAVRVIVRRDGGPRRASGSVGPGSEGGSDRRDTRCDPPSIRRGSQRARLRRGADVGLV